MLENLGLRHWKLAKITNYIHSTLFSVCARVSRLPHYDTCIMGSSGLHMPGVDIIKKIVQLLARAYLWCRPIFLSKVAVSTPDVYLPSLPSYSSWHSTKKSIAYWPT